MKHITLFLCFLSLSSIHLLMAATPKPEMKKVLDEMKKDSGRPVESLTVDQARLKASPQNLAEEMGKESGTLEIISSIEISDIKHE